MTEFCLGFLIDHGQRYRRGNFPLVTKKEDSPLHAGQLNGFGGKVELGETIDEAMAREFEEEAGFRIPKVKWEHFCEFEGKKEGYRVQCFRTRDMTNDIMDFKGHEEVRYYSFEDLDGPYSRRCAPHLRLLLTLAHTEFDPDFRMIVGI